MLSAAAKNCAAGERDKRRFAGNRKMENVWDATKLMLIVYGMATVVSFLVAWIIKLTFAAIRMQGARGKAPAETRVGPEKGA